MYTFINVNAFMKENKYPCTQKGRKEWSVTTPSIEPTDPGPVLKSVLLQKGHPNMISTSPASS